MVAFSPVIILHCSILGRGKILYWHKPRPHF